MDLNEILTWLAPMVAGVLLTLITSIITTNISNKQQLKREELKDTRNREWQIEDRKRGGYKISCVNGLS
jgi:phosphate/sulfate permease